MLDDGRGADCGEGLIRRRGRIRPPWPRSRPAPVAEIPSSVPEAFLRTPCRPGSATQRLQYAQREISSCYALALMTPRTLVGRARELAALSAALDGALSARTSLVLFSGEPGIGKSRLVD